MLPHNSGSEAEAGQGPRLPAGSRASIQVCIDEPQRDRLLLSDVSSGLSSFPKEIPPKWFYDDAGSRLFNKITQLPEYYPHRREREILARRAGLIASLSAADTLVELGSGFSPKTIMLLDAMQSIGNLRSFVPFDVSEESVLRTAAGAVEAYGDLDVYGVVGEFDLHLGELPAEGRRLLALLGGTIGNFTPDRRKSFLNEVSGLLRPGELLLLGADLVKDSERLLAAYDDAAGVTAEFNRNVLKVINRHLGADFVVERFTHVVTYEEDSQWIEMRLRSDVDQDVYIPTLGRLIHFSEGEDILTEISIKFRLAQVRSELQSAGFEVVEQWMDDAGDFSLSLGRLVGNPMDKPVVE